MAIDRRARETTLANPTAIRCSINLSLLYLREFYQHVSQYERGACNSRWRLGAKRRRDRRHGRNELEAIEDNR